jgi:predicted DNA-binding protein
MSLIETEYGYIVKDHPNGPSKSFINKKKGKEYNKKRAEEYLQKLNNLTEKLKEINLIVLPKQIKKRLNGYSVHLKGEKSVYFKNKTLDMPTKLNQALDYLNSKTAVQRLNVSGENESIS